MSLPTANNPVPVYNCVVHVAPPDAEGIVVARVANLPGLEGRGKTEREALAAAVAAFKAAVAKVASGEKIPFIEPPQPPAGQAQRLIAVHL
ncbi:MAG TPA: hypothetical protein VFV87_15910 [Pirellulaceae bacterium]|nr:hypothetical protein [Pirellulaceae bacterium]